MGVLLTTSELTYNLAGHVRHQGLPVAGVRVALYDMYSRLPANAPFEVPAFETRTGQRGEFTFPVKSGLYRLEVSPDANTRFLKYVLPEVKVSTNTTCNISLSTGCILSGTVRWASGEQAAACEVVALGIEPSSYIATSVTDDFGKYSLILPRGKYHLAVRSYDEREREQSQTEEEDSEQEERARPPAFISTAVEVFVIEKDDTHDFELPEMISLRGEVADIFGQPVVNARVCVEPSASMSNELRDKLLLAELDLRAFCRSDGDGKFEVKLLPGLFDITVEPDDKGLLFALNEPDIDITCDTTRKFVLSEGFRLRGQVAYGDEWLSECLVRIQSLDRKAEFLSKTDKSGAFSVGVPAGNYKLVVSAHPKDAPTITINGAEFNSIAPWTKMVVVGGDTHVSVRLQQGTALYGRISDENGQARPGVRVYIFADAGKSLDNERTSRALASGITDRDGMYCIFLSPGSYWLVVHKDMLNATKIEIGNEPSNVDIKWHGWCQLRFEVFGEDGQPVPRCRVIYAPYGSETSELNVGKFSSSDDEESGHEGPGLPRGYLLTRDDGTCQLTIPAGVYSLRFNPPSDGSYDSKVIRQLSISSDLVRRISLPIKQSAGSEV